MPLHVPGFGLVNEDFTFARVSDCFEGATTVNGAITIWMQENARYSYEETPTVSVNLYSEVKITDEEVVEWADRLYDDFISSLQEDMRHRAEDPHPPNPEKYREALRPVVSDILRARNPTLEFSRVIEVNVAAWARAFPKLAAKSRAAPVKMQSVLLLIDGEELKMFSLVVTPEEAEWLKSIAGKGSDDSDDVTRLIADYCNPGPERFDANWKPMGKGPGQWARCEVGVDTLETSFDFVVRVIHDY